jgi:putative membrane protein
MRYLLWIFLPLLFLFFITLAVKNTDVVAVRYFLGNEWRAPLILVLLVFFAVGAAVGFLAALPTLVRQRRVLSANKRELQMHAMPEAPQPPPPDVAGP